MESLKIVVMCIVAAVTYGVVHDQFTARICIEYFTIGHPRIVDSEDPTVLAFAWGFVATWWVGVLLGVPLAIVAQAGRRPKRDAQSLLRPVVSLLLVMAACTLCVGVATWANARWESRPHFELSDLGVPRDRHNHFLTAMWMHTTGYVIGIFGGMIVIVRVWRSRCHL
jgi:O-antigen/teichoic acid export membrane protein